MPKDTTTLPMCEYFNPLLGHRCEKGKYGSLKCHSENVKCPEYKPSEYKRTHQLAK